MTEAKRKTKKKATKKKPKTKQALTRARTAQLEKIFVEEYLLNWNSTDAYIKTYATENRRTARTEASKCLARPRVKDLLKVRIAERCDDLKVDQSYVIKKCLQIIDSDFLGTTQNFSKQNVADLTEDDRKLVQSVKVKRLTRTYRNPNGLDVEEVEESFDVKFMSKDAALKLLAQHTGMSLEGQNNNNVNVNFQGFAAIVGDLGLDE